MAKPTLPNNREAQILSILINGEKYGRAIRNEYENRTGTAMPLGSLYTTLDRMEEKGFVTARLGEATKARGGIPRKYFRLTAMGTASLNAFEAWCAGFREARRIVSR